MENMPIIPKKWRELSKNKKLEKCVNYLNLDEKEIKNIRKIEDGKTRLLKAAKLQYDTYKNIHSYITAWIAGYSSDVSIRSKFGSTKNLLELFYNTSLKNKQIKQSWADIKRKIKIPQEFSENLAEETGIHIGDGNLHACKDKNGFMSYKYYIYGHLDDDFLYHSEHINNLLRSIYNYSGYIIKRLKNNCVETHLNSRVVFEFKNKILKLPSGPKYNIKIPQKIINDLELSKKCLIGIFDTDFTLDEKIRIVGSLTSINVIKQIHKILMNLSLKHSFLIKRNVGYIRMSHESSIRFIENFGLNNQKHISKYRLWKGFKDYIPFSKTEERLSVLKGDLDIGAFKKICINRKESRNKIKSVSR